MKAKLVKRGRKPETPVNIGRGTCPICGWRQA